MEELTVEEWRKRFDAVQGGLPDIDGILTTADGTPAKLTIELRAGSDPLIFGRAYVTQTVGVEPKWVLQNEQQNFNHGLKVILKYKDRNIVLKRFGVSRDFVLVKSLTVVGHSYTKASVQATVREWLPIGESHVTGNGTSGGGQVDDSGEAKAGEGNGSPERLEGDQRT